MVLSALSAFSFFIALAERKVAASGSAHARDTALLVARANADLADMIP
jgi:hypothetical protein